MVFKALEPDLNEYLQFSRISRYKQVHKLFRILAWQQKRKNERDTKAHQQRLYLHNKHLKFALFIFQIILKPAWLVAMETCKGSTTTPGMVANNCQFHVHTKRSLSFLCEYKQATHILESSCPHQGHVRSQGHLHQLLCHTVLKDDTEVSPICHPTYAGCAKKQ